MQLNQLEYTNFKLLEDVTLKVEPGIYYIGGRNADVAGASSNMSGKSTLLAGLVYCLYGTDLRGKAVAGDIVKEGTLSASVVATFTTNTGSLLKVKRYRNEKPAPGTHRIGVKITTTTQDGSKVLDSKEGTAADMQASLDSIFDVCDLFLAAHIFAYASNNTPFADSTDSEQKRLFDLLVDAADLQTALGVATDKKRTATDSQMTLRLEMQRQQGVLDSVTEMQQADTQTDTLDSLRAMLKDIVKHRTDAALKHKRAVQEKEEAYSQLDTTLIHHGAKMQEQRDLCEAHKITAHRHHVNVQTLSDYVTLLSGDHTDCPVCKAAMTPGAHAALLAEYKDKIHAETTCAQTETAAAQSLSADLAATDNAMQYRASNIRAQYSKAVDATAEVKRTWETEHGQLAARIECLELEQTTRTQELTDKKNAADIAIASAQNNIDKLQHTVDLYTFWEKGFGKRGIRSYRLDMITPALNLMAARFSSMLFGDGTVLRYSTQTQNRRGDYRDEFEVALYKQEGTNFTRIDTSLSAGQSMRRDIIHAFSMLELADSLGKRTVDFIGLDELFPTLDPQGISAVLVALDTLTRIAGTIWVVEHNDDLYASFENAIFVERAGNASTLRLE